MCRFEDYNLECHLLHTRCNIVLQYMTQGVTRASPRSFLFPLNRFKQRS